MARASSKGERGSKSKAIRDALKANPSAKTSEIAEMLNKRGISVTAQYVSNMRTRMNKYGMGRRGRAVMTVDDLERIKSIAEESGGMKALYDGINSLEELARRVGGVERLKLGLDRLNALRS